MKRTLAAILNAVVFSALSQPISPILHGQAYHFASWGTPTSPNLFSSTAWDAVADGHTKLMRIGGNQYNVNSGAHRPPTNDEVYYVSIIDDIRSNGCEPVVTIPFIAGTGLDDTNPLFTSAVNASVANAKEMIRLLNVVHKRNIKYVVLANEPGYDYNYKAKTDAQYATNVAAYIKPIAKAIKEADPGIKIIGPEIEFYRTVIYDKLFDPTLADAACIAGLITSGPATGLPYIDYASYHYYLYNFQEDPGTGLVDADSDSSPNDPQPYNRDIAYTEIEKYIRTWYDPATAPKRFRGAMRDLREKCNAITTARGIYMGWMLTETNASLNNESGTVGNNPSGMDTRSLLGAQNTARIFALAMEYEAAAVCLWSVVEGCHTTAREQDRGFIDCSTEQRRGTWYHYEAMAKYFKGEYYKDKVLEGLIGTDATSEPNPTWLHYQSPANASTYRTTLQTNLETKAFAAKGDNIVVMILNHSASAQEFSIKFGTGSTTFTTGSSITKKFSFAMGITGTNEEQYFNNSTYTASNGKIEPKSTLILIFDCNANLKQKLRYREANEAQTNNTPFSLFYNVGSPNDISSTPMVPPSLV